MAQGLDWLKVEVEFLLFSSEKSLRGKKKKNFLKCGQVHRCRLREQDLAIKNPVVPALAEERLGPPSPQPALDSWRLCLFT